MSHITYPPNPDQTALAWCVVQ